jgi:hypothetical protein
LILHHIHDTAPLALKEKNNVRQGGYYKINTKKNERKN